MDTASSSIRFTGDVCGGLRTHDSLTFRAIGTAVVVASPTTEELLVAPNGKVRMSPAPGKYAKHFIRWISDPWTTNPCRMHCVVRMKPPLLQVSCLDVVKDGSLLAMGTTTTIGVPAVIYVWDVDQRKLQQPLSLHKVNSLRPCHVT